MSEGILLIHNTGCEVAEEDKFDMSKQTFDVLMTLYKFVDIVDLSDCNSDEEAYNKLITVLDKELNKR